MNQLSVIQVSVFTIGLILAVGTTSFKEDEPQSKNDPVYYWYRVNTSGEIESGSIQFSGAMKTVAYADSNDGCSGIPADCLRGFSSLIPSEDLPTDDAGDVQTHKAL